MRITNVRRSRTIKIVCVSLILIAALYLLFTDSDAPTRAKDAIHSRFMASKPKEAPKFITGNFEICWVLAKIYLHKI